MRGPEREGPVLDREKLQAIFKEQHLDIQYDKESANTIDFKILFQENLPAEAVDLDNFLKKYKEKD